MLPVFGLRCQNTIGIWLSLVLVPSVSGSLRGHGEHDLVASQPVTPFDLATQFLVASNGASAANNMKAMAIGDDPVVTDAGELFSMECAVAFASLPGAKYTPFTKLKAFCSATDQPVKCKQVVVEGLDTAIKAGNRIGGEMAFSNWCNSVWGWFAEAYGQHCLSQCTKTQCRSTCEWMSKRKKLDEQDVAIYGLEEQLKNDQRQLASDKEDLRRKKEKVQYEEGKKQSLKRKMKYQSEKSQNAKWRLGNSTASVESAKLKVSEMKNMIRNLTRKVEGAASTLAKAQGDQDMAEQKTSQIQDKVNKEQELLDETTLERAALDEEHQAKMKDTAALEMMIEQDTKKAASLKVEISEDQTTYDAKEQALTEQDNALAAEIAQKGPSEMLDIKGKYLKEERGKLKEFKSKLDAKKFELERLEQSVTLATGRITKMQTRRNATYNTKRDQLNQVIQEATTEMNALTTQMTAANTTLNTAVGAVTAASAAFEETEKKHQVAENTLPLLADTLKEKQAKLSEATEEEKEARADKRKIGMALGNAEESTEDAIVEMNSTWGYVNETTAKLNTTSMELAKQRKEINSQQFNHSKVQPFIVRHHDLAPPRP